MQTAFTSQMAPLMAGMKTMEDESFSITLLAEGDVEYGTAVIRGTLPETQGKNPAVDATTAVVVGVAVRHHNEAGKYLASRTDEMEVLVRGSVAVPVLSTDTVAAGDAAYMIVAATNYGKWTKTAGTNTVNPGAVFQTAKKTNNIAVIRFDIIK